MENMTRREREKKIREEEMITAAEKVFCQKGFDNASMDEIAEKAQFTKRTLYQYFETKEELFFAAALKGFRKLEEYIKKASENEQTGYIKLYKASIGLYNFYKDSPETMGLINYIGYAKRKSNSESQWKKELDQYNIELFKSVAKIIEEGKEDGSIRPELDAEKASFSLIFMMTGFFTQLSISGETFTKNFSLDDEAFSLFSMDLLFKSIINKK